MMKFLPKYDDSMDINLNSGSIAQSLILQVLYGIVS
jgi:hypothetical protein